jgi:hypothetical protein
MLVRSGGGLGEMGGTAGPTQPFAQPGRLPPRRLQLGRLAGLLSGPPLPRRQRIAVAPQPPPGGSGLGLRGGQRRPAVDGRVPLMRHLGANTSPPVKLVIGFGRCRHRIR